MLSISVPLLAILLSSPAPALPVSDGEFDDGVEVRVVTSSVPLHVSPRGERTSALFNALVQVLARLPDTIQEAIPVPEGGVATERAEYRIRLLGDRIRMEAGGSAMVGVVEGDGMADWSVIDPRTNRVVNTGGTFNRGLAAQNTRSLMFPGIGEAEILSSSVTPTSEYRVYAGHRTRRHDYVQRLILEPQPALQAEGIPALRVVLSGAAWLAVDGPFFDDRRVRGLFRQHAWSMAAKSYGHDSELHQLRRHMILHVDETTIVHAGPAEGGDQLMEASETMTVTSIEAADVDPSIFEPLEQESKRCDCTCRGFARLQEIGDMSHDEQEAQPDAMALSMCAPRCGMQWMMCGNIEDDEDE